MLDPTLDTTQPFDLAQFIQQHRPKPDEVDMDTQRRIAKGNAVGEAFRIMMDAVGGTKGANIQERTAPTNAVMGAVDKYYKAREANKSEQDNWDKMQLGAGLDELKTKNAQRYQSFAQHQNDLAAQARQNNEFFHQSQENKLNREQNATQHENELQTKKEEFGQNKELQKEELGLKKKAETNDTNVKYAQIKASIDRANLMYPHGKLSNLRIDDSDTDQALVINDAYVQNVWSHLITDPNIKSEMPAIMAKYGEIPSLSDAKFEIAEYFDLLTPETKNKIREFVGLAPQKISSKQSISSPLLPNANQPLPYTPGKGPLMAPQAPTIKTDKKSTIVQVQQPAPTQVTPEQTLSLQKIVQSSKHTPEQKSDAVYKYMKGQGYHEDVARSAADVAYQKLIGK
jgi:hypothetical protein